MITESLPKYKVTVMAGYFSVAIFDYLIVVTFYDNDNILVETTAQRTYVDIKDRSDWMFKLEKSQTAFRTFEEIGSILVHC